MTSGGAPAPDPSLVDRARESHVIVVGGGIAGLVAALDCAEVGMRVTLLEAGSSLGGAIRSAEVAGIRLDVGAESYATRGGSVRRLIDALGLGDRVVEPSARRAWLAGAFGAAPTPAGGILGIPENPWAPDVRRVIGWRGAWRAYLDRLRPPLTIGHEHNLATLVRTRMGQRVLDRLVAPVIAGVYSTAPEDVDVDVAAPGLNAALTRVGTLSGAVTILRGDRPAAAPGAAVNGIRGGLAVLPEALAERIGELGVEILLGTRVERVTRVGDGYRVEAMRSADRDATGADREEADAGEPLALSADAVLVATDEAAARRMLRSLLPGQAPSGGGPVVEVITLVLDAPQLNVLPRGNGVLTVPGFGAAKALTHSSAKWPWLADQLARTPGRHVVRLSFGSQGEPPATEGMSDAEAAELAVTEASRLLGVPLTPNEIVGSHRERYGQSQPNSAIGHAARVAELRASAHAVPGLGVAGAWLAGTGLAQVIPDAEAEAGHVRRHLLFGEAAAD